MDLKPWFNLPEKSGLSAFAEAQVRLYRHDSDLREYFYHLQMRTYYGSPAALSPRRQFDKFVDLALHSGHKISRRASPRKYKANVLFCPMQLFGRRAEIRFLIRSLLGLAQTGATILCLLPESASCRLQIEANLKAEGHFGQVTFIDPAAALSSFSARLLTSVARVSSRSAFGEIVEILRPHGLGITQETEGAFLEIARYLEAWDILKETVEFDAVVVRCHWHPLCGAVCQTARDRGKPAITFQHGVISHTLDVPVIASKYVAFGRSSATFLARMNRAFFEAVGQPEPATEFIPGGCLFDTILNLPNQFARKTLLIIDEPVAANDLYGIWHQHRALLQLAEKLLEAKVPPQRLIIRPHPFWDSLSLDAWKDLIRRYPNLSELSHVAWTLEDDLSRASAVVGIFSGALTVAAASGLPTFFLETNPGYMTEDLACFRPGQILPPSGAFHEISRVMTDSLAYMEARTVALRNAREYYANGANLNLDGAFFERMLRTDSLTASSGSSAGR